MLRAYPARFRQEYGAAMSQTFRDQMRHDDRSAMQIITRELADVALTAPRMRWENPMTRLVLIVVGATVAIAALLIVGPLSLVLIAAIAASGLLVHAGRDRDVEAMLRNRHWWPSAAVAVIAIGAAVAIAQFANGDDGELSAVWWTAAAVCILVGIIAAILTLSIIVTGRSNSSASPRGAR
jgi:hypothetical protein